MLDQLLDLLTLQALWTAVAALLLGITVGKVAKYVQSSLQSSKTLADMPQAPGQVSGGMPFTHSYRKSVPQNEYHHNLPCCTQRGCSLVGMLTKVAYAAPQIFLLGNALTLLRGCPWELMHDWVVRLGPVVHVQIANMSFVLVGSAEGVRRVFQTGALLTKLQQPAGSSAFSRVDHVPVIPRWFARLVILHVF